MSTAAAATPSDLPRTPARTMWRTAAGGSVVAVFALLLQLPLLATEPLFAVVTTAVVAGTVALGSSLAQAGERVSGAAFAAGGLAWLMLAVDGLVPLGPVVSWVSTGLPAVALGIGIVHYRRRRPAALAERLLPAVGLLLTVGARAAMVPFVDPRALDFPAGAWWPAPWAGTLSPLAAVEISRATLLVLAVYVAVLGGRALFPPGAPMRRWPVLVAASALAVGVAAVQLVTLLLAGSVSRHGAAVVTGLVVLAFVAGIPFAVAARRGFGAGSARRLPRVRTPETAAAYLCEITGDPTAELLYCSPDSDLLDGSGHRRARVQETRPDRFWTWVPGDDGIPVALLTGRPELGADADAVREWARAASVLAQTVRPSVLLRTRMARMTALRVAEELALAEERARFRRDLHDGLHQTIAAARMDLDGLHEAAPGEAEVVIAGLEAKMAVALAQVQTLGDTAAPAEVDAGLDSAIERAAARLRLAAVVVVSGSRLGVLTLPVFLLVREALTNVAKHACAAAVDVRVHSDGRTVEIAVSDDGRGGAVEGSGSGFGEMRRRVDELGGRLVLDSPPERGTVLRASIPCV